MMLGMDICSPYLIRADEMCILDPADEYGHILIVSQRYGSLIHDSQIFVESFFE